jgi:hypothetical protein
MVREFLGKVNVETGKTENRFNLVQLDQQLVYRPGEHVVCVHFIIVIPRLTMFNRTSSCRTLVVNSCTRVL